MSRAKAISKLIDEDADITEENIAAVERLLDEEGSEQEMEKSKPYDILIEPLNNINNSLAKVIQSLDTLAEAFRSHSHIIGMPPLKLEMPQITLQEQKGKVVNWNITYDGAGRISSMSGVKE